MKLFQTLAIGVATCTLACSDAITIPEPDPTAVTEGRRWNDGPAAQAIDHVLYPTGEYPTDVANVQAAVDQGGTILLKATDQEGQPQAFNFGTSDHKGDGAEVDLQVDVAILGETVGSHMTTIDGGWLPFFGVAHTQTAITGINFEGQGLSAMVFIASSGAVIRGNRVAGVVGTDLPPWFGGLLEGRGIKFLGNNDPQNAITGEIVIADNVIEDMDAGLADGIVFDMVAADVTIVGNRVEITQSSAVLMLNSSGHVEIAHNDFTVLPGQEFLYGNGIAILAGYGDSYRIENNRIVAHDVLAEGIFITSDELFLPGATVDDLTLRRNEISMHESLFGGITLAGDVSKAVVTSNSVDGDGAFAFDLLASGSSAPSRNRVIGLDASRFEATSATVYLDAGTAHNTVVGRFGSVEDLGVDNTVVNVTGHAGSPAGHGSGARAARSGKRRTMERAVESRRVRAGRSGRGG